MSVVLQLLVSGLLAGAVYALVALGLSLVFGIMRVINLAHGSFFALGSFLVFWLAANLNFSYFLTLPLIFAIAFAAAVLVERLCVRPVRSHSTTVAIVTLGVAILLEQLFLLIWGPFYLSMPRELPAVIFLNTVWDLQQMAGGLIAVLIIATFFLCLRTKFGVALRMVAQDAEGAELVGIDVNLLQMLVFGLAGGLAAVAGALTAPLHSIYPTMGRVPLIISLAVVIVGGLGNIQATLIAGLSVGVMLSLAGYYLLPQWSYLLALIVIIGVLLTRPSGLLGRVVRRD